MKQGDFTDVAKFYNARPAYSDILVENILKCANVKEGFKVAEIGAGTGKLIKILVFFKTLVNSIKSKEYTMEVGIKYCKDCSNISQ